MVQERLENVGCVSKSHYFVVLSPFPLPGSAERPRIDSCPCQCVPAPRCWWRTSLPHGKVAPQPTRSLAFSFVLVCLRTKGCVRMGVWNLNSLMCSLLSFPVCCCFLGPGCWIWEPQTITWGWCWFSLPPRAGTPGIWDVCHGIEPRVSGKAAWRCRPAVQDTGVELLDVPGIPWDAAVSWTFGKLCLPLWVLLLFC